MVEIKRKADAEDIVYEATTSAGVVAVISGRIEGTTLRVEFFTGDESLFDGMFRARLNSGEINGAKDAVSEQELFPLLCENKLPPIVPSISGFFANKHCGGNCSECETGCATK